MQERRTTKYLIGLLILLCVGTFSEGYDFFIMSLVLKRLGGEFHYNISSVFKVVVALVNCGAVLGFFIARLGDRFGRKPILVLGVLGFSGCSLLTALSPNIYWYITVQFFAKMFLVTEFGMAILIVSEEFPPQRRATYVGLLEVAGALGGGAAMFSSGVIIPAWGWRGMYWLGGAPLALVPVMLICVKETLHFQGIKSQGSRPAQSLFHIWSTPSRRNLIIVGGMWFLTYLCYAGVIYAWPTFAEMERGWTIKEVSGRIVVAFALGMLGYVVAGVLMDVAGRRITGVLFFAGSAASLIWAFTAHEPYMLHAIGAAMFFIFALLPICSTCNAELFPTDMRANASAWCNYLIGRPAQIVAPFVIGSLSGALGGIGPATCVLAAGPALAMIIVIIMLPETKGINLDKVH